MQFAVFNAVIYASGRGDNFTIAGNIDGNFTAFFADAGQHTVFGKNDDIIAVAEHLLTEAVRQFAEKFRRKGTGRTIDKLQSAVDTPFNETGFSVGGINAEDLIRSLSLNSERTLIPGNEISAQIADSVGFTQHGSFTDTGIRVNSFEDGQRIFPGHRELVSGKLAVQLRGKRSPVSPDDCRTVFAGKRAQTGNLFSGKLRQQGKINDLRHFEGRIENILHRINLKRHAGVFQNMPETVFGQAEQMIRRPIGTTGKLLIIHKDTDNRSNGKVAQRRIVFLADLFKKLRGLFLVIIRLSNIKQMVESALALDNIADRLADNIFKRGLIKHIISDRRHDMRHTHIHFADIELFVQQE